MKAWPPALAAGLLAAALALSHWPARPPESTPAKPLEGLPLLLAGRWEGREVSLTARELEMLGMSDHVSRIYTRVTAGPPVTQLHLFIGYYQSQRTGATYHSPLNCLPGTGWQVVQTGYAGVPGVRGIRVKKLVIQKELQEQVVLYWYHDRGRVITSEYAAKAYLLWDALRFNRTDGALVRILVPDVAGLGPASEEGASFLKDLWPELSRRLPKASTSARP
jgi:EpsI family protein